MSVRPGRWFVVLFTLLFFAAASAGVEPLDPDRQTPEEPAPERPDRPEGEPEDGDDDDEGKGPPPGRVGKGGKGKKDKIKPYDEVITEEAISEHGLFRVHRVDEKLYFEIPGEALDTEMVWVTQISETTAGSSYAGMPVQDRVVRWEQRGDKVLLRDVRYSIRAETDDAIAGVVEKTNLAPIILAFDVAAYGVDRAPVIDVTQAFVKDVPEFTARNALGGVSAMDSKRSFIEGVRAFPTNVETRVLASYGPAKPLPDPNASRRPRRTPVPTTSGITAVLHHSMVLLPDRPMKPRRYDERVGFFSVGFTDYADDRNHEAERVRYITRWRLEKKKPKAKMSEPVEPIVFYVGRGVPDKLKPYVKQGIEDWIPAFEAAGFKNAIRGEYPPDPALDPDWDPEDARISSIRWLPAAVKNAFGPHVHDPRTGEILEADVRMYHNVMTLVRDWYFVQAAASDERAQRFPLPDDLIGELVRFVVAHEVGHSLGFPHNMKASSSYTIAQLRDPEWTRENGTAPSIMDYARFNYVAQPGDGAGLVPAVGPYDRFAAEWGYREFLADADEKEELEKIVARQVAEPMLRFGRPNPFEDSTQQTEDLGDDAVEATRLGLANLERIADFLVEATCSRGESYDLLGDLYGELLGQWSREMNHVVSVVGGVRQDNLFYGDADRRFTPNDPDYQREAVAFLLENAFTTPEAFIADDIVLRLTGTGVADRVLANQKRILRGLVTPSRIKRMSEHHVDQPDGYGPHEMLEDLRTGIFVELGGGAAVDVYRRNLQRAYVDHLAASLEDPAEDSDLPALARLELTRIGEAVEASSGTGIGAAHLLDLGARIEKALDVD